MELSRSSVDGGKGGRSCQQRDSWFLTGVFGRRDLSKVQLTGLIHDAENDVVSSFVFRCELGPGLRQLGALRASLVDDLTPPSSVVVDVDAVSD